MNCPVCNTAAAVQNNVYRVDVNCPRCGAFSLYRTVFDDLPEQLKGRPTRAALMSHTIRRSQRPDTTVQIDPPHSRHTGVVSAFPHRVNKPTS
jgi:Zn-finger nucleic acid-binding protein